MPNSFQPIFRRSTLVCFCAQSSLSSGSPSPSSGSPPRSVRLLVWFASSCGSLSPLSGSPASPVLLEQSLCCSQTARFLNLMGASSYVLFISHPPTTGSLPRPPRLLPRPVPFATGSSSPVRPPPVRPPPVRLPVRFAFSSGSPHRPVTFELSQSALGMVRLFCALVLVVIESARKFFIIPLISLEETNWQKLLTKIRLGPNTPRFGLCGSALLGTVCRFVRSSKGGSAGKQVILGRTTGDSKVEI